MDTISMEPNPFLPDGRRWLWSSHSLGAAKQCYRYYFYTSVEGWRAKARKTDLFFGGVYAKAIERYHRLVAPGLIDHGDALHEIVRDVLQSTWIDGAPWASDHNSKTRETLIRSVIWYLEAFRDDPCKTVMLASGEPAAELPFEFSLTDEIVFRGRLDRVVEYANFYYVQDQKTTGSTLGAYYFERYNPDNQISLYSVAAKIIYRVPIVGVMIDAAQIAGGFTRFERGFSHRTEAQLEEWLKAAEYKIKETWRAAEAGYPMNDKACFLCEFKGVCGRDPAVREEYLNTYFEKDQR